MKLAIIHANPSDKFSARLTLWFTGSTAYHCGFVDESDETWFDMSWLPRKTAWPRYFEPKWANLYDVPGLTRAECEEYLKADSDVKYGFLDYILFGIRPLYHLFGKSTRNASGMICSEMCHLWLKRAGYEIEFDAVPSPKDLEDWAIKELQ